MGPGSDSRDGCGREGSRGADHDFRSSFGRHGLLVSKTSSDDEEPDFVPETHSNEIEAGAS